MCGPTSLRHISTSLTTFACVIQNKFQPGTRPAQLDAKDNIWLFKEMKRVKRKIGCDAWVNSGGVRGGRNLQNMDGEIVLRRRYGKVIAAADGGRRAKLTGDERRYMEYTLLSKGPNGELLENRDIRLCVSPRVSFAHGSCARPEQS